MDALVVIVKKFESNDFGFWKANWGLGTAIVVSCAVIALVTYVALILDHHFGDYGQQVPFPEVKDWSSVRITLDRDLCGPVCPAYAVELHGDGTVVFQERNCETGFNRPERISQAAVEALLAKFRAANFLSLRDQYVRGDAFDFPTVTLSLSYDGVSKTVIDYAGELKGMPLVVRDLQNAIDETAQTARWATGPGRPCFGLVKLG